MVSRADLCVGRGGGDAVSGDYGSAFAFTGGGVIEVVYDLADDQHRDVERELAMAPAVE